MAEHRGNKRSWSLPAPKGKKRFGGTWDPEEIPAWRLSRALHGLPHNGTKSWTSYLDAEVFVGSWLWDVNHWNLPSSKKMTLPSTNVLYRALGHNNQFVPAEKTLENWFSNWSPIWSPANSPSKGLLKPADILTRSLQTSITTHFDLQPTCQESTLLCHWRNCHFKTRQKNHVTLEQQQKNLVCMNYFADNSDHTHRTSQGTLRDHRHVLFFHPVFHVRTCIKILQVSLA